MAGNAGAGRLGGDGIGRRPCILIRQRQATSPRAQVWRRLQTGKRAALVSARSHQLACSPAKPIRWTAWCATMWGRGRRRRRIRRHSGVVVSLRIPLGGSTIQGRGPNSVLRIPFFSIYYGMGVPRLGSWVNLPRLPGRTRVLLRAAEDLCSYRARLRFIRAGAAGSFGDG